MKNIFTFLLVCVFSITIFSQENEIFPVKFTQNGFASLDYISVKMPNDEFNNPEINMGLTGIHYNLFLNQTIYAGLGFYGSVNGKRGGLFTLGINLGIKKNLSEKLFFDGGFHLGAGGGAGAPDGGGAMFLPHVNLGYQFKKISTTIGYSYINFFDKGNITSNQFRVGIQIPLSYDYTNFKEKEKSYSVEQLKKTKWNQKANKYSFLLQLNNYLITGDSRDTKGNIYPNNTTIRVAGFEIASYLKNNWLIFFKADGAFHGIDAGYMDLFIGAGYSFAFNKEKTKILTKLAIGAGGGGGLETQGGFLIQPDISIEQKLFNTTYVSFNKGYILTPNSFYTSSTYGIGLKYYLYNQGLKKGTGKYLANTKIKGLELHVGNELYFNAQRRIYPKQDLHQLSLQINLFLNKNIFLAGFTSFASFGNAGAYAEGIVGVGYQTKPILNKKVNLFTQFLAGAAGGGHISTGQGLILKPSLGLNYKLNNKLNLRASIGKVKAHKGSLNSTSINFGLNYRIGFLTAN